MHAKAIKAAMGRQGTLVMQSTAHKVVTVCCPAILLGAYDHLKKANKTRKATPQLFLPRFHTHALQREFHRKIELALRARMRI